MTKNILKTVHSASLHLYLNLQDNIKNLHFVWHYPAHWFCTRNRRKTGTNCKGAIYCLSCFATLDLGKLGELHTLFQCQAAVSIKKKKNPLSRCSFSLIACWEHPDTVILLEKVGLCLDFRCTWVKKQNLLKLKIRWCTKQNTVVSRSIYTTKHHSCWGEAIFPGMNWVESSLIHSSWMNI